MYATQHLSEKKLKITLFIAIGMRFAVTLFEMSLPRGTPARQKSIKLSLVKKDSKAQREL